MTIRSILKVTADYFNQRGISSARLDAEVLLGHVLGMTRIQLYVNFDQPLQTNEIDRYRIAVRDRAKRVPVAYIVGSKEFMSLDFSVGPGVLIPRPDTEILVEAVLARLDIGAEATLVDIGAGSGAISISIAKARPLVKVYAVDISELALSYVVKNTKAHDVWDRVIPLHGDLYAPLSSQGILGMVDGIVSNPPYIPGADISGLEPEVSIHEPRTALDGGGDGLDFYRRLLKEGLSVLKPGGWFAFEVGQGQAEQVAEIARVTCPGARIGTHRDLAGIERVVTVDDVKGGGV